LTPFFVFDLSQMGKFIKERKKDIPILKMRRINNITPHNNG
jgi:hypothetical protein